MHKHKKKYGQNFLNNSAILDRIMSDTGVSEEDRILEIGPGDGALTELLIGKCKSVTSVEIDEDLKKILDRKFSEKDNFDLIMKDFLQLNFEENFSERVKVVANIPYYITSPIVNKLIENRRYVDEIYIMVQKEVGERIAAQPGNKNMSLLTYLVNFYGSAKYMFTIPKVDFTPAPKVDSAFIKITLDAEESNLSKISEKEFFKFARAAFSQKRKNIINNLSTLGYEKKSLRDLFEKFDLNPNKRAEDFSVDDFIELIEILKNNLQ